MNRVKNLLFSLVFLTFSIIVLSIVLVGVDGNKKSYTSKIENNEETVETQENQPFLLTASYGQTLKNLILPDGYFWQDGNATVGEVGEHEFKVYCVDSEGNITYDIVVNVVVTKSYPSVSEFVALDKEYDGLAYDFLSMLSFIAVKDSEYVIECKGEFDDDFVSIDDKPLVDVGDYLVRIRFVENDKFLSSDLSDSTFVRKFSILPMQPNFEMQNSLTKKYDRKPVDAPVYSLNENYSLKDVKIMYRLADGDENSYSTIPPTEIGNYILHIEIVGENNNFANSSFDFPFVIEDDSFTIIDKEYVGLITGSKLKNYQNVINDTQADGDVRGTDLGYPVWDSTRERLLLFFGDTVGEWTEDTAPTSNKAGHKDWRNNVMMVSTDEDYSDGLDITGYLTYDGIQPTGHAIEVIKGHKDNDKSEVYLERSKLPTGGIEIDGVIYMTYMSKFKWGYSIDSINYGGFVKSVDGGETWTRVNSLSWANHSSGTGSEFGDGTRGLDASLIEQLMNEDIDRKLTISKDDPNWIDVVEHEGYFFTTINPVDGKDGYIYLFGEGAFRSTGVKLARVKRENFEDFTAYDYLQGYDESGEPIWLSYKNGGLKNLNSKENQVGFVLGNNTTGAYTTTAMYNKYLQKWVLASASSDKGGIFWATADNVWGPYDYDSAQLVFSFADGYMLERNEDGTLNTKVYCGYVDEHLTEEDGRIVYIVISQFSPIYESSLVKITLGKRTDNVVRHLVPLSEMSFLDELDESRILNVDGKDYYCIHETYSFNSSRKAFFDTISVADGISLSGFVAESRVDNEYIIYRRKKNVDILGSVITVLDGEKQIENDSIAWIGYKVNEKTNKLGASSGKLVTGEDIYYNAHRNYIFFGCESGYEITEIKVFKTGSEVNASLKILDDGTWRFLPASTTSIYRFEVTVVKKNEL